MKRILVLLSFLCMFNTTDFGQSSEIGWSSFYNEANIDFSTAFKEELSQQLMKKFDAMMEIPGFAQDKKFMLLLGITPLKTSYRDSFAFILVDIVGRDAMSTTLTAYWKASDVKAITKQKSINFGEVEFGWCADFDKNRFMPYTKDRTIKEINGLVLKFKCEFLPELYPDISISYHFKYELSEHELKELNGFLKSIYTSSYVSEIEKSNELYYSMIDIQSDDYNEGLKQLEDFILQLNICPFAEKIESITIE